MLNETYFFRDLADAVTNTRLDNYPKWMGTKFNLFPVVLDRNSAPWPEATLYITAMLEDSVSPTMSTWSLVADDLAAFKRFIEENNHLDWTVFPQNKLTRPTYRYRAQLMLEIQAGLIAVTTAKRRMSTVIRFYRWLIKEEVLNPDNAPWIQSDKFIHFKTDQGFDISKKVPITDIGINIPKNHNPFSEYIDDGGALRPLPKSEQEWILEALISYGNTELTLMHLFALVTGARIQTALTFKVRHVLMKRMMSSETNDVRVPIGPGTGIDTKNDKRMVLFIPVWFYEILATYSQSARAKKRRMKAQNGDTTDQYLFLSVRGSPFYRSKEEDSAQYDARRKKRYHEDGRSIRTLITEFVIPIIHRKYDQNFHYRFHDLRASDTCAMIG